MGPLAGFSGLSRDRLALAGLPHVSAAGRCGSAGRAVLLWPSRLAWWWSHSGCAGFQESRTRPSPLRPRFGTSTLSLPPYPIGRSKPQSQARFKQGKQTPPPWSTCEATLLGVHTQCRGDSGHVCRLPGADETAPGCALKEPAVQCARVCDKCTNNQNVCAQVLRSTTKI